MSEHACEVDWLFQANGPDDPAWLARVRAEAMEAPVLIEDAPVLAKNGKWTKDYDRCRICGSNGIRHEGNGRCRTCNSHWRRHGGERPASYWQKERAS